VSETGTAQGDGKKTTARLLLLPGVLLGIGLGGFVDGIVIHQLLQWHHMISSEESVATVAGLEANTLADGLFHAAAWVVTVAGVIALFRRMRRGARFSGWNLAGWMLVGWGAFDLVEGIVDHHILGLHHVRPGPNELAWDLGFLAFGAALVLGGLAVAAWSGRRSAGRGELQSGLDERRAA
jgi:uncharacterized membrane protein